MAAKFVSSLYDPTNKCKANQSCINSIRYQMALTKNLSVEKLPPSLPAFRQHFLRSKWQCKMWSKAREQLPEIDVIGNGWLEKDGLIRSVYFEGPSAMQLLGKYFCDCEKRKCKGGKCSCCVSKFKCS